MFDPDYSGALLDGTTRVNFTHAESEILRYLASHPGQTLSRSQILDATTQRGSDRGDRTVDFLINRIRRKLNDSPKAPEYIATRYGGGYVWVAKAEISSDLTDNDTDVLIGPFRGLDETMPDWATGEAFADNLASAFQDSLDQDLNVRVDAAFSEADRSATLPTLQVELAFFRDLEGLECVVTFRTGRAKRVFFASRLRPGKLGPSKTTTNEIRELVKRVLQERWRADVDFHAYESPLPVAMQNASVEQFDSRKSLDEIGPKLRTLRERHPDDPHIKLLYGTYMHSEYVVRGYEPALCDPARREADKAEIENLVLESLEYAQSRPHLAVMSAKLLYFTDKGYKSLALELAKGAHSSNTVIAPSLAIVGQLHAFVGDTGTAIDYLKQADALSERDTVFDRYVLVLLCQALIAAGRRDELEPFRSRIYAAHPLLRIFLEPLFTDPDHPSMRAKGAMFVMSRAKTTALLSHLHFIWTRLCEVPEHQVNALRAPISLAIRRHGRSVVPDEIYRDIPGLFS